MWFHIQFLLPINYLPIQQDRRLRSLILVVWPFSPNREAGLWLSLGGFQEKGPDDKHIYNTHVLLDDSGNICSVYRKIHLYTFSPSLYIFYIKYLIFQYIDSGLQGVITFGGILAGLMWMYLEAQYWKRATPLPLVSPIHSLKQLLFLKWFSSPFLLVVFFSFLFLWVAQIFCDEVLSIFITQKCGLHKWTSGTEVVMAESPAGRLGLTVCYDLRFPELYQRLRFTENCEVRSLWTWT